MIEEIKEEQSPDSLKKRSFSMSNLLSAPPILFEEKQQSG
jgi:hypothetical protein